MPAPTRPNSYPIWTQGNNAVRQQPTNGEQFTGFVPNFRPPSGWHNWLFGIVSDWIAWLDYITSSAANFLVSNVGHNILTGTTLQAQLDECDAFLSSLGLTPIILTPTANPAVYTMNVLPLNQSAPVVFVGGTLQPAVNFVFAVVGGQGQITFNNAPAPGQAATAFGLSANQPGAGGSSINGGWIPVGTVGAPEVVAAAVGVPAEAYQRTLFFSVSAGGVYPITATPQIAPGTKVGQELRVVGTSDANAIQLADGNGLSLNGPITLGSNVSIDLYWNGLVWVESDRSN
jgi:hypothetical protein